MAIEREVDRIFVGFIFHRYLEQVLIWIFEELCKLRSLPLRQTFVVVLRPSFEAGSVRFFPVAVVVFRKELNFRFVLQRDHDHWSPKNVDETHLEQLRPKVIDQVHQQTTDVETVDVSVRCNRQFAKAEFRQ